MLRIILTYRGDSVELPPGESVIGRGLACQLRFNDPSVSRAHVRIENDDGRVIAEDAGSKNGTLLNGQRLHSPTELHDGDELRIGFRRLRVAFVDDGVGGDIWEMTTAQMTAGELANAPQLDAPVAAVDFEEPVEHNCPRCRESVPFKDDRCTKCDYRWPPGRPAADTQPVAVLSGSADRRGAARHPIDVPVLYSSETLVFDAVGRDVSRGGMFIATDLLDPIGTPCTIAVLPEGHPAMRLSGEVCHVVATADGRVPGLGIRLTSLAPEAERWLAAFLARYQEER